ncbi:MAG: 30S ribosomal protein S2 [Candidatus Hydrogenedentes bacterium]|nr:30S ribosomal protein S2 [Candidatus Hydrogenedentota bacterium]
MAIATMRQLLEAGIHFGHQTRRWHPKMQRYIYGQRNGVYIIDLQHTLRCLYRAYALVRDTVADGGNVLFVGTKKQAQEPVEREAKRCGMYFVTNRWLGGTLTNFQTVQKSIQELNHLKELETTGRIERYSKKEGIQLRKRREKLEKNLSGIAEMPGLPDVLFVIDTKREEIAVREAERLGIASIGIVDTNCDPDQVAIAIPGNDDAIRSVSLFCSVMADAVLEGRMLYGKTREAEDRERASRRKGGKGEAREKEDTSEVTRSESVAVTSSRDARSDEVEAAAEVAGVAEI